MIALQVEMPRVSWQAEKSYEAEVTFRDVHSIAVEVKPGYAHVRSILDWQPKGYLSNGHSRKLTDYAEHGSRYWE